MEHPITPPPELVEQWVTETWHEGTTVLVASNDAHIATQAARWGADQELEACCEWVSTVRACWMRPESLRTARRPKPPSLKEQALEKLAWIDEKLEAPLLNHCDAIHTIRRALEQLDD